MLCTNSDDSEVVLSRNVVFKTEKQYTATFEYCCRGDDKSNAIDYEEEVIGRTFFWIAKPSTLQRKNEPERNNIVKLPRLEI